MIEYRTTQLLIIVVIACSQDGHLFARIYQGKTIIMSVLVYFLYFYEQGYKMA
jgi:hypothetical protein